MQIKNKLILLMVLISIFTLQTNDFFTVKETTTKPSAITLNIITRQASDVFKPFRDAFVASDLAKNVGITSTSQIIFWSKSPGEWKTEIQKDYFDVAWGGGSALYQDLAQDNLLVEIEDTRILTESNSINETIAGFPLKGYNKTCATDCSGNPVWIANSISSYGFTVNHDVLDNNNNNITVPTSWGDLANISYYSSIKPLVAIGNAPYTTSNTRIYEIILQKYGWEAGWALISVIAGNSVIYQGSTEVLDAVISGKVGIGLTIDFYGFQAQKVNASTEYILPNNGSIIDGDPIALLKGPVANRDAANAFIQFVLSSEGQSIWLKDTINRLPARDDVFDTTIGQTRPDLKYNFEQIKNSQAIKFNSSLSDSYNQFTLSYFQSTITDISADLQGNWSKIVTSYRDNNLNRSTISDWIYSFGYPVLSESEAIKINSQAFDTTLQDQWKTAMKAQYFDIGTLSSSTNPSAPKISPINYFETIPNEESIPTTTTDTTTTNTETTDTTTTNTETTNTKTSNTDTTDSTDTNPISATDTSKESETSTTHTSSNTIVTNSGNNSTKNTISTTNFPFFAIFILPIGIGIRKIRKNR